MSKSNVILVAGLGFGDEGKGTTVEYLTHTEKAHTVVRYNGGAQAAHNVVLADGRHHTFSQFGSGTFQGAATHLSRFMLVEPMFLRAEAAALRKLGIADPFSKLTIERGAPLITPYHRAANRFKESVRLQSRHGSCGMGIGETVSMLTKYGRDLVPVADDLNSYSRLLEKLAFVKKIKLEEMGGAPTTLMDTPIETVADAWTNIGSRIKIVDEQYLQDALSKPGTVIFEGAQGVLLDKTYGFFPFSTPTDITFNNAIELIGPEHARNAKRVGVIRSYQTRHGPGPLPTEAPLEVKEGHNAENNWQGGFRTGHFDIPLLRYALDVIGELDHVVLTHADCIPKLTKVCTTYTAANDTVREFLTDRRPRKTRYEDLPYQQRLGRAISGPDVVKNYKPLGDVYPAKFICPPTIMFAHIVRNLTGIKIGVLSYGPRLEDKARF
jgi:adenylosuccinate synthase